MRWFLDKRGPDRVLLAVAEGPVPVSAPESVFSETLGSSGSTAAHGTISGRRGQSNHGSVEGSPLTFGRIALTILLPSHGLASPSEFLGHNGCAV